MPKTLVARIQGQHKVLLPISKAIAQIAVDRYGSDYGSLEKYKILVSLTGHERLWDVTGTVEWRLARQRHENRLYAVRVGRGKA